MEKTLSDRILLARKRAGLTQKQLAEQVGISLTAMHKLETGRVLSSRRTVSIALVCGVDPIWLERGTGNMLLSSSNSFAESTDSTFGAISASYSSRTGIPLVTWELIDSLCEVADYDQIESAAQGWVPIVPRQSRAYYALKVPDDSMEPEFSEGEIIIVDNTQSGDHNKYLIARLQGDTRTTFKQLIILGKLSYLKPLNDRYPLIEIEGELKVCGVVVCKYKRY